MGLIKKKPIIDTTIEYNTSKIYEEIWFDIHTIQLESKTRQYLDIAQLLNLVCMKIVQNKKKLPDNTNILKFIIDLKQKIDYNKFNSSLESLQNQIETLLYLISQESNKLERAKRRV